LYSLLIKNGLLLDGTGAPRYRGDVALCGDTIARIAPRIDDPAARVIDAAGRFVTPGFIDIHRHADGAIFRKGFGELELRQGLTTIVNGNCGLSASPFPPAHRQEIFRYLRPITGELPPDLATDTLGGYFQQVQALSLPLNVGMLVGAGVVRAGAAGYDTLRLSDAHFEAIHASLSQALSDGALGVSLGLGYAPECFYTTTELIRALSPLKDTRIPLTVHMRQEGGGVVDSVAEMITVAESLHCPVHISHLKAMGRENWNQKIPQALELLEKAKARGLDVGCDVYPYTAGSTQLMHILPPNFLTGGMAGVTARLADPTARQELSERIAHGTDFDNIARLAGWDGIFVTSLTREENRCYLGKSIDEIAALQGKTPLDACCDLLISEHGEVTMIDFMASEDDIARILRSELSNVISDATYPTEGQPHPRVYGMCTHLLTHFVRERAVLTWEEGVRKLTSVPADVLHLSGKGVLKAGKDADLLVFDGDALRENATYQAPRQCSDGMDYVIVGGGIALEGQAVTSGYGRVIQRRK
jgi:N-acyl-D-amino-acid deacylase